MSLDEIMRRIVRAHFGIILACVLIPLLAVVALEVRTPVSWDAKVRLQTTSSVPSSSTEADALSSRVLALATTPSLVQRAMGGNATEAQATKVATRQVSVTRLGESSIVELTVSGSDPEKAKSLATALAGQVTRFMNTADRESFSSARDQVDALLTKALARRDKLQTTLREARGRASRNTVSTALMAAQTRVDQLRDEQSTMMVADAERDVVVPVDTQDPAVLQAPSTLVPRAALAVLLGLLVGLAIAVVSETLRPRIGGIRVFARLLDAPLLGTSSERIAALANSLTLAARRQGVETVVLVGADERDEKAATRLLDELPRAWASEEGVGSDIRLLAYGGPGDQERGAAGSAGMPAEDAPPDQQLPGGVRFTNLYGVTSAEEVTAGIVVVSTGTTARRDLDALDDMLRALRWPMIGVIENDSRR